MKNLIITAFVAVAFAGCTTVPAKADTIVVRQPGLVEAVGQTAVGLVACTAEMAKGLVCGSTTVVQTPNYAPAPVAAAPVAAAPVAVAPQPVVAAPAVVAAPTVVAPAVPLAPYGAYYTPGYCHYYGGCGRYYRPCRPCRPCRPYNPYLGGGHWGGLRPGCGPCRPCR